MCDLDVMGVPSKLTVIREVETLVWGQEKEDAVVYYESRKRDLKRNLQPHLHWVG